MDKILVLLFAGALITAIAWWFYGNKHKVAVAASQNGDVQTATIIVDGGYSPNVISLQAGTTAKLTFLRKDPTGCLAEIIMPDFGVSDKLPVNQPHEITIEPTTAGTYTYTCGMRMFSGTIEVIDA